MVKSYEFCTDEENLPQDISDYQMQFDLRSSCAVQSIRSILNETGFSNLDCMHLLDNLLIEYREKPRDTE